jgi:methyltransferase (TIGR00027 family)
MTSVIARLWHRIVHGKREIDVGKMNAGPGARDIGGRAPAASRRTVGIASAAQAFFPKKVEVNMARTDNDTWDLATSVGATATGVAVGRALASRGRDPLINDPFAEPLVRAVGVDFFTRLASGELNPAAVDDGAEFGMARMTDMMAVRTRFFDDFFLTAAGAGIRQAVILASGLDARAYRLPWPAGTTVYEIDQPTVIEFKTRTLQDMGAAPTADRRAVAIDLRHDWPAALRKAGLDPAQPTVWSAEGLLAFLPPEAQDRLLDNITALSSPGSRLASENASGRGDAIALMRDRMHEAIDRWREHGFDVEMTDLWYAGDRNDVAEYLAARGWDSASTRVADLYAANGLALPPREDAAAETFDSFAYVTATRR